MTTAERTRRDGHAGAVLILHPEDGGHALALERALSDRGLHVAHVDDASIGFALTRLGFVTVLVGQPAHAPPIDADVIELASAPRGGFSALVAETLAALGAVFARVGHRTASTHHG